MNELRTPGFCGDFDERGAVGASGSSRACGRIPLIAEMTDVREIGWSTVGDDSIAFWVTIIVRVLWFGFREEIVNNR